MEEKTQVVSLKNAFVFVFNLQPFSFPFGFQTGVPEVKKDLRRSKCPSRYAYLLVC